MNWLMIFWKIPLWFFSQQPLIMGKEKSFFGGSNIKRLNITLPETNIAPENGWLGDDPFLLGRPIFRGYVSFREGTVFFFSATCGYQWFFWKRLLLQRCPWSHVLYNGAVWSGYVGYAVTSRWMHMVYKNLQKIHGDHFAIIYVFLSARNLEFQGF